MLIAYIESTIVKSYEHLIVWKDKIFFFKHYRFRPKVEGGDGGYSSENATPEGPTTQQQQHQQFLGDASGAIPNFGEIDVSLCPLPEGINVEHILVFQKMYREHSEVMSS